MEVTVAKSAGFCFGVKRAVDTVYREIESGEKPVYTFGHGGKAETPSAPRLVCADCKGEITQIVEGGTQFTALQVAEKTRKRFGRCLCWNCASKA